MFESDEFIELGSVFPEGFSPISGFRFVAIPEVAEKFHDLWGFVNLVVMSVDIIMLSGGVCTGYNRLMRARKALWAIRESEVSDEVFCIPEFLGHHGKTVRVEITSAEECVHQILIDIVEDIEEMAAHVFGFAKAMRERHCELPILASLLAEPRALAASVQYATAYTLGYDIGKTDDYRGCAYLQLSAANEVMQEKLTTGMFMSKGAIKDIPIVIKEEHNFGYAESYFEQATIVDRMLNLKREVDFIRAGEVTRTIEIPGVGAIIGLNEALYNLGEEANTIRRAAGADAVFVETPKSETDNLVGQLGTLTVEEKQALEDELLVQAISNSLPSEGHKAKPREFFFGFDEVKEQANETASQEVVEEGNVENQTVEEDGIEESEIV